MAVRIALGVAALGSLLLLVTLAQARAPAVPGWEARRAGLVLQFRGLADGLRLEGPPGDIDAVQERFNVRNRALRKAAAEGAAPAILRARYEELEAIANELMRRDETLELEVTKPGRIRIVSRPEAWRILAGGVRRQPILVRNASGRATRIALRRREGEVFGHDVPAGSAARVLLPIEADAPGGAVALRVTAGEGRGLLVAVPIEAQPSALLRVGLVDEAGGPAAARLSVESPDGRSYTPEGARRRLTVAGRPYAHAAGEIDLRLPLGPVRFRISRGFEYRVQIRDVEITPEPAPLRLALERWIDMPARGWYSGDGHVHVNYGTAPEISATEAFLVQRAEDLHVVNALVANHLGDDVRDVPYFEGAPNALSTDRYRLRWNQEFRSSRLGHLVLYDLTALTDPLFAGFAGSANPHDFPLNADIADQALAQGATVTGAHPSWTLNEHAIDIALGKMHGLEVAGYAADYPASLGLVRVLWSLGFRVALSAGTDAVLNRMGGDPPGGARAYAHVGDEFDDARWVAALRAGRTFVSTGPMLWLTVGDAEPGDTIRLSKPEARRVVVECRSQWPLSNVRLYRDGGLVAERVAEGASTTLALRHELSLDRSGWIAAACNGPHNEWLLGGPLVHEPRQLAHTSAVWVEVAGRPAEPPRAAHRLLRAIDGFATRLVSRGRFASDAQRDHMRATYDEALGILRERVGAASPAETSGDP